jgi:hypothetical protein
MSTWYITDIGMYAAMLVAFSTGRRLVTSSRARWLVKRSLKPEEGGGR